MIVHRSLAILHALEPNLDLVKEISRDYGALFFPFTLETIEPTSIAHSRMFDPFDSINEEAATGTATGALMCYLYRHGLLKDLMHVIFEQGYSLQSPSEIIGSLSINRLSRRIQNVIISGRAVIVDQKEIEVD